MPDETMVSGVFDIIYGDGIIVVTAKKIFRKKKTYHSFKKEPILLNVAIKQCLDSDGIFRWR